MRDDLASAGPLDAARLCSMLDTLAQADTDLRAAIGRVGYPAPRQRDPGFGTLLRIILAQQVSTASAAALWRKLDAALGGDVTPASFLTLDDQALRACGFSARKVEYARGMSAAILGESLDLAALALLEEEAAISALVASARLRPLECPILTCCSRSAAPTSFQPTIRPCRSPTSASSGLDARPSAKALRALAEPWRPSPRCRSSLPMALLRGRHLGRGISWPHSAPITGAGSGLGLALAVALVARGSTVLGLVRRQESAAALLAATADRAAAVQGDVTEPAIEDAIAAALARHRKPLDLLVNNAGAMAVGLHLGRALDPAEVLRLIDLHCNGALRCTRAALPALRLAERAMVVNVSSRLASLTRVSAGDFDALRISYAMRISKAALNMATICLARELAADGIAVHCVHPGPSQDPAWQVPMPTSPQTRRRWRCCACSLHSPLPLLGSIGM